MNERKCFLSQKVKEATRTLNEAVKEAQDHGLRVEFKSRSLAMTEDTPPLQVRIFEQVDY